jgi:hypothetical protein
MLHGVEKQRRMIDILHDVEGFDFYLTGSRYFGTESSDSDWDFFTTDSEVLRDWLRVCGFKRITAGDRDYPGQDNQQELIDIYKHPEGVDVQIVQDVVKKQIVQSAIKESGIFNSPYLSNLLSDRLWKREIWRSFYRLFNVGML